MAIIYSRFDISCALEHRLHSPATVMLKRMPLALPSTSSCTQCCRTSAGAKPLQDPGNSLPSSAM